MFAHIKIDPMGAPRMTQRDAWKKRPVVEKYFRYKDLIRYEFAIQNVKIEDAIVAIYTIPMPKSWSKKKKKEMEGKVHDEKPDTDNITKGILDSIFEEDKKVATNIVSKVWGYEGKITILKRWPFISIPFTEDSILTLITALSRKEPTEMD